MISSLITSCRKRVVGPPPNLQIKGNQVLEIATLANLRSMPWLLKENYFEAKQIIFAKVKYTLVESKSEEGRKGYGHTQDTQV